MEKFEEIAKQSAKMRRENIKLIPDDCKINPKYLDAMTSDEFVIPCTGIKTNARAELSVAANGKLGI